MKGFENGVEFEDENIGKARDVDALLKYVRDRLELESLPAITDLASISEATVVAISGANENAKLETAFNAFADKHDMTYNFANFEDAAADEFKIAVYKNGAELASFDSSLVTEDSSDDDVQKAIGEFAFKHLFTDSGPVVYGWF